jgi:hypothetical protein
MFEVRACRKIGRPALADTRRIVHRRTVVRCILLSLVIVRVTAQETTFSTDVKVVSLLATVRGREGNAIKNLIKDDFILEEDGRPQIISYFTRESDLHLTIGLLVDTSKSVRHVLEAERHASYTFLGQVLREGRDTAHSWSTSIFERKSCRARRPRANR